MKFTLSWLKEHLDTDASVEALVHTMTMIGIEVENVENPALKYRPFTAARVVEARQHPNADKLQVCQVDTVQGRLEIVCGALNARAGLVTIFAPIGTYIPGTGITLEPKPVRGVVSNGMLCSEGELELGGDLFGLREKNYPEWRARADQLGLDQAKAITDGGIAELPNDIAVGAPLAQILEADDPVFDIEVTPNRPDWLGVMGIARDLAAAGMGKLITRPAPTIKGKFVSPISVGTDDPGACMVFGGRYIRGVKNGPSPEWLQRRLRAIGLRPRSALVDVTNFLTFDRARPLHVYDADKVRGHLRARLGRGETFKALDGETYEATPDMCVIADDSGVLGFGGVMGGESTGCTESTVNVLIEAAVFDNLRTFRTGRMTGINSDARYRNERGIDPASCAPGLELATKLILEFCGGEPSDIILAGEIPAPLAAVTFDPERVKKLAGISVPAAKSKTILKALGFEVSADEAKKLVVQPPSWRRDVEGPADLVEEVARIVGYDELPANAPPRSANYRPAAASVGESRLRIARRALAAAGYQEAVTWSFCRRAHAELFGGGAGALALANPIAPDLDCMRPTALINLLIAAQRNSDRGHRDARLFEAGPAYLGDQDGDQIRTVAAVWQPAPQRHWKGSTPPDIFDVKRDCLAALAALGAPTSGLQTQDADKPFWRPGRSAVLKLGNKALATFGEIHPRTLATLGVDAPALAFEILVDAVPAPRAKATRAKPPLDMNALMPLTRDFAFIVEEKARAADLVRAVLGAEKGLIADVCLFDVYRGQGVPEGKKSLAIEVTLQPKEKTLTDAEIEAVSGKIVQAAAQATGAQLRA
ncbi:MAG: phenylalanine--tRNA ligase subunit beta [Hyphomonadaceae bacterium]|nr:phenylalanine--tRNA ligase subunit beta [Hyphomonadaceae bacterium]